MSNLFLRNLLIIQLVLFFLISLNVFVKNEDESAFVRRLHSYRLPKFWTNTGFCPLGDVSAYLLRSDVRQHLNLIGSLPSRGLENIRVHWLLDLIDVRFEDANHLTPMYNFTKLDTFIGWIDEAGLSLGFEFMGNLQNLLANKTDSAKSFIWMDLSYEIGKRYLTLYGIEKMRKWKFESWNEPDLKTYNRVDFNLKSYLLYAHGLQRGLRSASEPLKLRGPAGLFKDRSKHPLCWNALKFCNDNLAECPFDILTFHRKGNGKASEVALGGRTLLAEIFSEFPNLQHFAVSNDEADPIAGWSTARAFQSDINYAVDLIKIVLDHWSMALTTDEFSHLESISHDNAFMSYHPFEFSQRTLFARFQMNNSAVPYTQFVAKPVYVALGMLSHMGDYAEKPNFLPDMSYMTTTSRLSKDYYLAIIAISNASNDSKSESTLSFSIQLPSIDPTQELALCIETLQNNWTNPIELWNEFGNPPYPTAEQREWMRRIQGPRILESRLISAEEKQLDISYRISTPWVALIRICTEPSDDDLSAPTNIRILNVADDEVLIFWRYDAVDSNCIKTFEIHFKSAKQGAISNPKKKKNGWDFISRCWRVPFHYFQYRAIDGITNGSYKVRAIHISGKHGPFSKPFYLQ